MKGRFVLRLLVCNLLFTVFLFGFQCNKAAQPQEPPPKKVSDDLTKRFQEVMIPITPEDRKRMFDCVDEYSTPNPIPYQLRNQEFNYFAPKILDNLYSGLIEVDNWPLVLSYLAPLESKNPTKIFVTLRGDTFGYHKSFITKPYLNFMKEHRKKDGMLFLDEYAYVDRTGKDIYTDRLMSFCHHRTYWFGNVRYDYPGVENGRSWKILNRLHNSDQKYVFLSYSNGTWLRMEFIKRIPKEEGYAPNYIHEAYTRPVEFLKEYMENTKLETDQSLNIEGFIDIEGNYTRRKPLWDILSYIKQNIDGNPSKFYYAMARVDKPDAFPVQVIMIQALGLEGEEDNLGIVRYSNPSKNVIIDVVSSYAPPHYANAGANLKTQTKIINPDFKPTSRVYLSHFNMMNLALERFRKAHPNK